jgi:DNA-directed RNA polymerase subunit beta'
MSSKKLETIVYYERYVVIQGGIRAEKGLNWVIFLLKKNTLILIDTLPKDNQYLPDEDPQKFIAKMGAEAVHALIRTY